MIIALILFNTCHWLADYTQLSTKWMLSAKRLGSPVFPIWCHASVHGILFFIVALALSGVSNALHVYAIQTISHFIIDVLKGKTNVWFPSLQSNTNVYHWWIFGADQWLHQLVIIYVASTCI